MQAGKKISTWFLCSVSLNGPLIDSLHTPFSLSIGFIYFNLFARTIYMDAFLAVVSTRWCIQLFPICVRPTYLFAHRDFVVIYLCAIAGPFVCRPDLLSFFPWTVYSVKVQSPFRWCCHCCTTYIKRSVGQYFYCRFTWLETIRNRSDWSHKFDNSR